MAILITSDGTYIVVPGETYIIDPGVQGTVKFEAADGAVVPVDFSIELNDSPTDPTKGVKIQTYGDDGDLSPTLTIADNYNGPNTEIDFDKAADSEINGGDDVTLKTITGSKTGDDDITFGNDAYISDGIKTQAGDDTLEFGTGLTVDASKTIDLGDGSNSLTAGAGMQSGDIVGGNGGNGIDIGDGSTIGKITTGDGVDTVELGNNTTAGDIDTNKGDDSVTVGDGVTLGNVKLGGTSTLEMNSFVAGNDLTATKITTSNGEDTITIGDDATIPDGIDTKDGDDLVTIGDGFEMKPSKTINLADGDDTITIGDEALLGTVDTGKGDDDVDIGSGGFIKKLDTGDGQDDATVGAFDRDDALAEGGTELDGGGDHSGSPQDCLTLDLSWLTPAELAAFEAELLAEGYESDGMGGYTFVDADGDGEPDESLHVTLKLDLDGDGSDDFTFKLKHWEKINVVCFARGTLIATRLGSVPIESLRAGDEVITMDHGFQKIRWIGSSTVPAMGHLAPVVIRKGAMGNERDLRVSPQHRMLVRGWHVELLFGKSEALVPAKALINDETVFQLEGGEVDYFHMMFDRHELIYAEGIPSESFHPGHVGLGSFSEDTRQEIMHIFPELREDTEAYSDQVRPALKVQEARVLAENPEFIRE